MKREEQRRKEDIKGRGKVGENDMLHLVVVCLSMFKRETAHLGHLGQIQKRDEIILIRIMTSTLDQLKRSLEAHALYTHTPPSHDDATLLFVSRLSHLSIQLILLHSRFLRARKFDPAKAHNQFAATEAWRHQHDVNNLYATSDPDELESSKRFYPRWTGRRDKVRQRALQYLRIVSIAPNLVL
jgi:hypothetical protein